MKIWIKRGIVILAFVMSLILFSIYYNLGSTDSTAEQSPSSLPLVYADIDGRIVNEMHGYRNKMDVALLNCPITPIGDDRQIKLHIETYGRKISNIRVELRSRDGNRLVEDTQINDITLNKDIATAVFSLKDLIEKKQEYSLNIIITTDRDKELYYYTKIYQNENCDPGDKLRFVYEFSGKTFSKDTVKELSRYLEPNSSEDNRDFGYVNIHSSLSQVSWGDLNPELSMEPQATIYDISDTMASIELRFQVKTANEGRNSYYNITEFYRIRKTAERYYLLSYDRSMSEMFVMDKTSIESNKIAMGIQYKNTPMEQSEGGEILAFVNQGRLYSLNMNDNKLVRLFAFYQDEKDDYRHMYASSDIKILKVEETGNISFLVYGYMNRGLHEGNVGVSLYYYDSIVNTVEEQVFIPYTRDSEILMKDIERLSFLNPDGELFLYLDAAVVKINISNLSWEYITKDFVMDSFYSSATGNMIVWQEPDDEDTGFGKSMYKMNLTTGEIEKFETDEYIRILGFMNEDAIYGLCRETDARRDGVGNNILRMHKIIIMSPKGETLKEYSKENVFILDGSIRDNQIVLQRCEYKPDENKDFPMEDEHITNTEEIKEGKNKLVEVTNGIFKEVTDIIVRDEIENKSTKLLTPKEVIYEGSRSLIISSEARYRYYTYGNGHLAEINTKITDAIQNAYNQRGYVIDSKGIEIYKRGELKAKNQIMAIEAGTVEEGESSKAVALSEMMQLQGISRNMQYYIEQGQSIGDILKKNLKNMKIIDLTGTSLEIVNYYLDREYPILAMKDEDDAVLITGYNSANYVIMDPAAGTLEKMGTEDVRKLLQNGSDNKITYISYDHAEDE